MINKPILIVEDDPGHNFLLQRKIRELGFDVAGCTTIKDAFAWCLANEPLFILLDYKLGNADATKLITMLQKKGINNYFVILTAYCDHKIAVEMMKLGALDYIIKEPAYTEQLAAIINRIIGNIETKEELRLIQEKIIKNEEKYRTIFENILDVYFECSPYGKILEISPSVEQVLKYRREELLGKSIGKIIPNVVEIIKIWKRDNGLSPYNDFEINVTDADGETKCCSLTSRIIDKITVGILRDISERKKFELKLLNAVISTEEKERKRFSADLHDGLGPLLSTIRLNINRLKKYNSKNTQLHEIIHQSSILIDEVIADSRNIANNLTPSVLNDFGLPEAVKSFIKSIKSTCKTKINFNIIREQRLPPNIEIILFRFIQELINNTIKHANAKNIIINLTVDASWFSMEYQDDGIGFEYVKSIKSDTHSGFGLMNLMNKAKMLNAYYTFDSKPGKGVKVGLKFNFDKKDSVL